MIAYMGWIVAAFFGIINIAYLINKDNRQKGETEIKECVDVLKRTFETAMEATPKIDLDALITQVESLSYLRLVKENNIIESILKGSVVDVVDQIRVHRYGDVLQSIGTFLCLFDVRCQTIC